MTEKVDAWKQRGNVYLWRYQENCKNFPGWHLAADRAGAESLLILLAEFKSSTASVYRTITLSKPTINVLAVPNNKGGKARWWAPSRFRINFDPNPEAMSLWSFPVDQDPAVLFVGREFLLRLEAGIVDLSQGKGDYSIGGVTKEELSEQTSLWFWW